MGCLPDHLVVVADTLDQGVRYCGEVLGVEPCGGGQHPRMGTHNRLLSLGPGLYLEVIAVDPDAPRPELVRWFGMDMPRLRQAVKLAPRLVSFVARCDDIDAVQRAMPRLGTVLDMQRDALSWRITVPVDGAVQEGGCLPSVLQWPQGVHPSQRLPDSGCRLHLLEAFHPDPSALAATWAAIGLHDERLRIVQSAAASVPHLLAHIDTPGGRCTLGSTW